MKQYVTPETTLLSVLSQDVLTASQVFGVGDPDSLRTIGFGDFEF